MAMQPVGKQDKNREQPLASIVAAILFHRSLYSGFQTRQLLKNLRLVYMALY